MKVTIENDFRRGLSGTRNLDPVGWVFAVMNLIFLVPYYKFTPSIKINKT